MCLNPIIILNPAYSQHRHEFLCLCLDGRFIYQKQLSPTTYYPAVLPPFASLGLSVDNLDRFVAVDSDGCITKIFMPVPCNKCVECMESKQSAIRVRMLLEQMSHNCSPVFITLTYDNDHLPADGVSKTDVKRFLNRLHLYLGRAGYSTYFRHVMFSEYGSFRGRAHYHGILYGLDWIKDCFDDAAFFSILEKAWSKGFVRCERVHGRAFRYVSKYVGKDAFMDECKGRNPNFWTASRRDGGLGSQICKDESFLELCSTPRFPTILLPVEDKCYEVTLPAYVRDKILPPLSKYISKSVRDAYIQFKKDLLIVKMASETLFDHREYIPLSLLHEDLKKLTLSGNYNKIDGELLCDDLLRSHFMEFQKISDTYDPLLCHYYIGDEYWRINYREIPRFIDWMQVYTRLLSNYELLASSLPDVPFILTQLHARKRVSDRFALAVEKHQSELPPPDQRALMLFQKGCKHYTERVKDCQ